METVLYLSIEINGIGIVSAKYKEIKALFTKKRFLNFFYVNEVNHISKELKKD